MLSTTPWCACQYKCCDLSIGHLLLPPISPSQNHHGGSPIAHLLLGKAHALKRVIWLYFFLLTMEFIVVSHITIKYSSTESNLHPTITPIKATIPNSIKIFEHRLESNLKCAINTLVGHITTTRLIIIICTCHSWISTYIAVT